MQCKDCGVDIEIGKKYCDPCEAEHGIPEGFSIEEVNDEEIEA